MPPKDLEGVVRTVTRQGWDKKLLFQASPGVAAYDLVYTAPNQARGIVTLIVVCNTVAGAGTYRLHHDDAGGAGPAAPGTALRYDKAIGGFGNEDISGGPEGSGIVVAPGGKIWFGSASGDVTASGYGYEEQVI